VRGPIARAVVGRTFRGQAELDGALEALDGTPELGRLGANAALPTSLAFARAAAAAHGVDLHAWFAALTSPPATAPRFPRLTVNLFSGGKHAGGQVSIQDVLIVPATAQTIDEQLVHVAAVVEAARELVGTRYGERPLKADEGGLAPGARRSEELLDLARDAIHAAELTDAVRLAVDVAATHFHADGRYRCDDRTLDAAGMRRLVQGWIDEYGLVSVEDAFAEDDWGAWGRFPGRVLTLGDDLLCTNVARVRRAVAAGAANALLLKVNQAGTVTRAIEARDEAVAAGWSVVVSARSGETEDDWLADLAVGLGAEAIKVGSIQQSERLAKYNRLLELEHGQAWPVANWPGA
jgi:enolase